MSSFILRGAGALALVLCLPSLSEAQVTYRNDSLTTEGDGVVICGFAVGEKFAAVFVPDAGDYPFLIDEVHFMLAPYRQEGSDCVAADPRTAVNVTLEIWNDDSPAEDPPRPPVYQSTTWSVASSATALNVLTISDDEDVLIESGVVRVAVTIPELDTMPIRDIDGITTERNLIYDTSPAWSWAEDMGVTGDWLLRMVVIPQGSDDVEPPPDASDDAPDDAVDDLLDVPADIEDDGEEDPAGDVTDGRLGGGGCGCALAGNAGPASVLVLLVLVLLVRTRRFPAP